MTDDAGKRDDDQPVDNTNETRPIPFFADPNKKREAEEARKTGRKARVNQILPTTLEGVVRARASLYKATMAGKVSNAAAMVRMKILDAQERSLRAPLTAQVLELKRQLVELKKGMMKP